MHPADLVIIVLYLLAMPVIGLLLRGKQRTGADYFVGGRNLPWWAVCLSVVATETSTLTVISTPGLVWGTGFTYLQLALGYIIGRFLVSITSQPSESEAQASFRAMQKKYPDQLGSRSPIIKKVDGKKGTSYRALVGPFASREEATRFCSGYSGAGGQCWVP